jgi:Na+/proline symporter
VLTRRATQLGAIAGMLCGLALDLYLWKGTHIAWTWYVTFGATTTFVVGYAASFILNGNAKPLEADGHH